MKLRLQISNLDAMPDGGPLFVEADSRGIEIGRDEYMDWTLPDDNRYISGRHCEIKFDGSEFQLFDVSTNGTLVNDAEHRMRSPHVLREGDRLQIGHYIIEVEINETSDGRFAGSVSPMPHDDDFWGDPTPLPPIDVGGGTTPTHRDGADFSDEFHDMPKVFPGGRDRSGIGTDGRNLRPDRDSWEEENKTNDFADPRIGGGNANHIESDWDEPHVSGTEDKRSGRRAHQTDGANRGGERNNLDRAASGRFRNAFAQAAGLDPRSLSGLSDEQIAQIAGQSMREVTGSLMELLKARASAKRMAKSSSVTVIGFDNNNPLKFKPTPQEALETMFDARGSGFKGAQESFSEAFNDLREHEFSTYSSMQRALSLIQEEIDPDTIEAKVSKLSGLSSKKSRAWDAYVAWWDTVNKRNENGILDVFLDYFAKSYDRKSR